MINTYQLGCLKLMDIGIKLKKVILKFNFKQLKGISDKNVLSDKLNYPISESDELNKILGTVALKTKKS